MLVKEHSSSRILAQQRRGERFGVLSAGRRPGRQRCCATKAQCSAWASKIIARQAGRRAVTSPTRKKWPSCCSSRPMPSPPSPRTSTSHPTRTKVLTCLLTCLLTHLFTHPISDPNSYLLTISLSHPFMYILTYLLRWRVSLGSRLWRLPAAPALVSHAVLCSSPSIVMLCWAHSPPSISLAGCVHPHQPHWALSPPSNGMLLCSTSP